MNLWNNHIKDQIFFVEKESFGASHLYFLADFNNDGKSTWNDDNIELFQGEIWCFAVFGWFW